MRRVADHACALDSCLQYFLSSMETLHGKVIVDTLDTIYATEAVNSSVVKQDSLQTQISDPSPNCIIITYILIIKFITFA